MADESAPTQSRADLNKKWAQHIEQAKKCEKEGNWEGMVYMTSEAGNGYFEAAQFKDKGLFSIHKASSEFLSAADCYHKALCEKAYDTYLLAIDRFLKNNEINQAIHISVKCGYQYEKDWSDFEKGDEFYDKANKLRKKYNRYHLCALTSEFMHGVIGDVSKKLKCDPENAIKIIYFKSRIMFEAGVCRKCIPFHSIFLEYFAETRKKENMYENSIKYRNKIEWLKEYHEKFKEILTQTIVFLERLVEERKKRDPVQRCLSAIRGCLNMSGTCLNFYILLRHDLKKLLF
ncbi:hypothetical protein RF11_05111 [Thelohanellus kitauei]|uniref:Alpha-soluble NSF attachment protein n=1 Tax=Thelohanellus kitauei TaxID=669202 RepID=A0A0C2J2S1_THEKT|nr:hypothetical protein RF11_05111 [Thelohanellus kitauei]